MSTAAKRKRDPSRRKEAEEFHFAVTSEPCLLRCRPDHVCDGPLDAHHVIEKQHLRGHFLGICGDNWPAYWGHVYDAELGVCLCRRAHEAITTHADYIYFEELPARVIDRAKALGLRHRLERESPSLHG